MKTLILLGSGEFTEAMDEFDKKIISKYRPKRIVILPTAAGKENDFYKWIEMGVGHFERLGVRAVGLPVISRREADEMKYIKEIKEADWIYFSGGDPQYLYETLKETKLWKEIFARYSEGAILAGSSAGAIVMGKFQMINIINAFEKDTKPNWVRGFGLVNWAIFPHFDWALKHDRKKVMKFLKDAPKKVGKIAGIDEDTAVIVRDSAEFEVWGNGKIQMFRENFDS